MSHLIILLVMPMYICAQIDQPNVLIINSYHKGLEWTDEQTEAILGKLVQKSDAFLFVEYMDWKRYPTEENLQHLYEYLKYKYAGQKIDLIFTTDDRALEFALEHRHELFSDAPLVFSGVLKSSAETILAGESNVTGVYEKIDPEETLSLALKINPSIKNIYVIYENTESGRASGDSIAESVENYNRVHSAQLEVHDLSHVNLQAIQDQVAGLDKNSIVVIGSYNIDKDGLVLYPERFSQVICEKSKVPVYSVYEVLLGSGIIGGSLLSPTVQGENAAELGLRILNSIPASDLQAIDEKTTIKALDYQQLVRFNFDEDSIPKGSIIINKPFSFLDTYRYLVYRVASIFALLLVFIVLLLQNIHRRKKAEEVFKHQNEELSGLYEELAASEEELRKQFESLKEHQEVLKDHQERHKLVIEATKDTIWDWDIPNNKRIYSQKLMNMLGYRGEEIEEYSHWYDLIHPDDKHIMNCKLEEHLEGKSDTYYCEYRIKGKDEKYRWISAYGKALFDSTATPYRMVGSHRDITDLKEHEQQINYLAFHDYLTGLPNRVWLKQMMEDAISHASRNQIFMGVLYVDLDNFKVINDSFGHRVGDQMLIAISSLLTKLFEDDDAVVAKLGGDEFIILLKKVYNKEAVVGYAEKIMNISDRILTLDEHACHISMSVGIAIYPFDGASYEELLKNADTAMYKAKELGRRRFVIFNQKMNDDVVEKARLQNNLRRAIDHNEFVLYYQPQVDLKQGKILGLEALIRWYQPDGKMIEPQKFIPVAEETGLIVPIGEWVLRTACIFAKKLHNLGYADISVAVNLSAVQLRQEGFVQKVLQILDETELPPGNLELEITETVLIEFIDRNINTTLNMLKDRGIHISLDDFGRGYSSLNYIRQLPISTLKIDKSFIDDIQNKDDNASITGSIIILAHKLGLRIVAEGVEIDDQLEYLKNYHCDAIQGYLVSNPLAENQFLQMLVDLGPNLKIW